MARLVTLEKILRLYRVRCGLSTDENHNTAARQAQIVELQIEQERLHDDFDWPFMHVERFIEVQSGQRYYAAPEELDLERAVDLSVRYASSYQPLCQGIGDAEYSARDSDLDERCWPVLNWRYHEGADIELWPVPSINFDPATQDGRIKVKGTRKLKPFVKDGDCADLDDILISHYAAARYLVAKGNTPAAQAVQAIADERYSKLKGAQSSGATIKMFGRRDRGRLPLTVRYPE